MALFSSALLILASATPQLPWGERIVRYEDCVRGKASQFEAAGEPIKQTVDAAFAACSIERAGIMLLVLDVQSSRPDLTSAQREAGRENAFKDIDERLREELTSGLFEKRSTGKNNAED